MLGITQFATAQMTQNYRSPNFWDNVRFGGGLGLGFGNDFFSGSITPSAIYQVNDKFATVDEVGAFILAERAAKREELQNVLTTALKVDGDTKMGIISDIKQELRKVNALKINYTTRVGDYTQNLN